MESLIVCATARLPMSNVLADNAVHRALTRATLLDNLYLAQAWRQERIAVDPNRRVVVLAEGADAEWFAFVESSAKKLDLAVETTESAIDASDALGAAFSRAFDRGARGVAAIPSTSPALTLSQLDLAFRALQWEGMVLGPELDGRAWLIGAARHPAFAACAPRGFTADTSLQLVAAAQQMALRAQLLPYWYSLTDEARIVHLRWQLTLIDESIAPHARAALSSLTLASGA